MAGGSRRRVLLPAVVLTVGGWLASAGEGASAYGPGGLAAGTDRCCADLAAIPAAGAGAHGLPAADPTRV
jgi:hypothetical protein